MSDFDTNTVARRIRRLLPGVSALLGILLFSAGVSASTSAPSGSFGAMAQTLTTSFPAIVDLIVAVCYITGMAFAATAIFKFKQHKDAPQQHPLGVPVAMLFIAAALIWLPAIVQSTGASIFGASATKGYGSATGCDPFAGCQ